MKEVELLTAAWFGDSPITINFPSSWEVNVVGEISTPALTDDEIREVFNNPMGGPRLSVLARKRNRAAIIIDDITRPTPTAKLISYILEELKRGGISHDSTIIVVASGTHTTASDDDIRKKVGESVANRFRVIPHDCRKDLVYLGKSSRGTPLYVNQAVVGCDLKIGVGGIYPHAGAGFSGGSKIIMPGVCGVETARYTHYYVPGSHKRAGSFETEFREEVEEVSTRVGLDFIVNVVLNGKRDIAGLFVGEKVVAHREGAKFARQLYSVDVSADADIVVANAYPIDTSLIFSARKGLWPLFSGKAQSSKVGIAACPLGLGFHGLTPLLKSYPARIAYRMKYFKLMEFLHLFSKMNVLRKGLKRRQLELLMLSPGITREELETEFPKGKLFGTWGEILNELEIRHNNLPVKVAVYPFSPLQIPV